MNENIKNIAEIISNKEIVIIDDNTLAKLKLNFSEAIPFATALDKSGYRKQSDTVKEFAEKIAPLMNAMRLIDADALLSDIERTIEESGCVNHEGEIMDCVRYATTVDIAQVCRLELAEQFGKEE